MSKDQAWDVYVHYGSGVGPFLTKRQKMDIPIPPSWDNVDAAQEYAAKKLHVAKSRVGVEPSRRKSDANRATDTWYVAGYNYPKGHRDRRLKFSGGSFASRENAAHAMKEGRDLGYYMEVTTKPPATWWDPSGNRAVARSTKTRKNPLTAATRVATLASLGVDYDPSLFYSVKGGKLYARERTGGGGYGRGRLGKARLLGTIPGFKKSLFYSVSNGVVSARRRK